jgi:Zn-finger nucleic acid-binding protein
MKCPVCKKVALEAHENADGPVTHACGGCGGKYVKSSQYFAWLDRHGENVPERPADQAPALPVADSKPGKLCPECGAFLIRHEVGHDIDFAIDRCGRCGGIWLDGNEWETLVARGLHDDVHMVFSEAYQTELKRRRRADEYGQTVTDILDEKLTKQLGEADFAKLKEFQQWLAAHDQAEQIYAYLMSLRGL